MNSHSFVLLVKSWTQISDSDSVLCFLTGISKVLNAWRHSGIDAGRECEYENEVDDEEVTGTERVRLEGAEG